MIEIVRGNLFETDAEALVNTVNCDGYMGKGIALQFKKAFPANFKAYEKACRKGEIRPGRMFVFETGTLINPKYIINFPTKQHWREKSRLEDIEAGLKALVEEIKILKIHSISIPPLGCGLGGLDWNIVRPKIEQAFSGFYDVNVQLFEPVGAPTPDKMPIQTQRPKLTVPRALLIKLMQQYNRLDYQLTLLEVQKLAYFLQEAGEPLKLKYVPALYGPYAHNLNKVLEVLEGHFIRGFYGDSCKPDVEIKLLAGAVEEVDEFLAENQQSKDRLEQVSRVIEGFETPYGMELLSSLHWVAVKTGRTMCSKEAIEAVHRWNDRKRRMLKIDHLKVAWKRLVELGWVTEPNGFSS